MIYKVFPEKDTFITSAQRLAVQQTGSNFGASEILEVSKRAGVSGALGTAATASISRMLFQFDLSQIANLTASGKAPSTGSLYFLKLFDAQHSGPVPSSCDIEIVALSSSWDEGKGIDTVGYADKGFANWDKSTSTTFWTTAGGDYLSSQPTASYHFDTGNENVEVEITNIVNAWLTGGLPNFGIVVKLQDSYETDTQDYFIKKIHARNTHFSDKRPTIEMRWDDSIKDDRGIFLFDVTSSLYLYNRVRGQLQDISGITAGPNVLTVNIADLSGTILTVSGSHTGLVGIYSASFSLPTGSYSGSLMSDKWGISGKSYLTGTFVPHNDGAFTNIKPEQYVARVINNRKEYETAELVRFNLFVKTRNYNPAVVQTGSLVLTNTTIEKGYYRIDNDTTKEIVIPLGTGSLETTRLSYDEKGNYFNLYMSSLCENEVYRIVFFFNVDGQLQKLDEKIRFKVTK